MDGPLPKPRLREQFRAVMRLHHYSVRTEKAYWCWIRYCIRFHQLRHPRELGADARRHCYGPCPAHPSTFSGQRRGAAAMTG